MSRTDTVVLAAGLGTRMKSDLIKVLHEAAGQPLIDYVINLAGEVSDDPPIVVIGHQRESVKQRCGDRACYAVQEEQLGTGHAVLQAEAEIRNRGIENARVLVLSGDVPLTRTETIRELIEEHERTGAAATVLTMKLDDPAMYGRVVRGEDGNVTKIVEAKEASEEILEIDEVNTGMYVFDAPFLFEALHGTSSDNAQGEYYLTDVLEAAAKSSKGAAGVVISDPVEAHGVNSRSDLALVERELQRRNVERLMTAGVTFRNAESVTIDHGVEVGPDSVIYGGVVLEGTTTIGRQCIVGPGTHLVDTRVADRVHLKTGTVASEAVIGNDVSVGPYAHLRPGTVLGESVKVGNFVETKKANFGKGSKASHLSYIGDAEIGANVNIGAGTITCNYDGVNKHKTVLEDGVFIGSDTQLVAPVTVGSGAYVGAGSTITKNVPADSLALSRTKQKVIEGWAANKRREQEENRS